MLYGQLAWMSLYKSLFELGILSFAWHSMHNFFLFIPAFHYDVSVYVVLAWKFVKIAYYICHTCEALCQGGQMCVF